MAKALKTKANELSSYRVTTQLLILPTRSASYPSACYTHICKNRSRAHIFPFRNEMKQRDFVCTVALLEGCEVPNGILKSYALQSTQLTLTQRRLEGCKKMQLNQIGRRNTTHSLITFSPAPATRLELRCNDWRRRHRRRLANSR